MEQAFPHAVIHQAFQACGHRCECTDPDCDHTSDAEGRCTQFLRLVGEGDNAPDGWRVHRIDPGGPANISNCRILCTNCSKHAAAAA